jgi:hypothetical protein
MQVCCKDCQMPSLGKPTMTRKGCALIMRATCKECQLIYTWDSQPKLGQKHAGNVLIMAAILVSWVLHRVYKAKIIQSRCSRLVVEHNATDSVVLVSITGGCHVFSLLTEIVGPATEPRCKGPWEYSLHLYMLQVCSLPASTGSIGEHRRS